MLKINYNFSLFLIALITLLLSCKEEKILPDTYNIPTRLYLEFSDGTIIDEVSGDDCWLAPLASGLVTGVWTEGLDSAYIDPHIAIPKQLKNPRVVQPRILFYGYDTDQQYPFSFFSIWQYILDNEENGFNNPPYKMNFFLEYSPEGGTKYKNSWNGGIATSWPYATDEGDMQLTNVKFSQTDHHIQCPDRDEQRTIRVEADIEGMVFNYTYSDTVSVSGFIDIQIVTENR
jgi:hypothetical protein